MLSDESAARDDANDDADILLVANILSLCVLPCGASLPGHPPADDVSDVDGKCLVAIALSLGRPQPNVSPAAPTSRRESLRSYKSRPLEQSMDVN